MAEIDRIGRLLKHERLEDDEAWFAACLRVAERVRALAQGYEQSGHPLPASSL